MLSRVFNGYRHNDRVTKNDRIYTINKDFNVPQIRYRVCRTRYDTTAYSTVSNEQQGDRGISVITPLPRGERGGGGGGEGGRATAPLVSVSGVVLGVLPYLLFLT